MGRDLKGFHAPSIKGGMSLKVRTIQVLFASLLLTGSTASAADPDWPRIYLGVESLVGLYRVGGLDYEHKNPSISENIMVHGGITTGARVSSYMRIVELFHLGLYLSGRSGEQNLKLGSNKDLMVTPSGDSNSFGIGASIKLGKRLSRRMWLGGAMDMGLSIWSFSSHSNNVFAGMELFPAVTVDLFPLLRADYALGLTASVGVLVTPFIQLKLENNTQTVTIRQYVIEPMFRLGVVLGR